LVREWVRIPRVSTDFGQPVQGKSASHSEYSKGIGASWGDNGTIVFAPGYGTSGLSQVSGAGGTPRAISSRDSFTGEEGDRWPELLPGGKAVLFTAWSRILDESQIVVQRLDTPERRIIIRGGTSARYVPTGHIVYARAGSLMAVPFDVSRLEVTGEPISVAEGVALAMEGVAQFDLSKTGSLVYVPGSMEGLAKTLVWVDRKGAQEPLAAPAQNYLGPRLSPDGQQVAVEIRAENDDIWVYDIPRETLTRLTFGARADYPQWTPDGTRLVFRSLRAGVFNLFWKLANGGGDEERLTTSQNSQALAALSRDGQAIVFQEKGDFWILPLTGDRTPRPFFETPFFEGEGAFSPDGRYLAYSSDESGRQEIWVRPFPAGPGKWQISTEGGVSPRWALSGELFYKNGDKMMAAELTTQPGFAVGKPRVLFEGRYETGVGTFDVSADGQRFLMVKASEEQAATQVNVVLNWFEELRRRVPTGR
jgi:hypothetical protein